MRLWSLHPRYLDPQGWSRCGETLLARKVLRGETRGYRHHPQLQRFREARDPQSAIDAYLPRSTPRRRRAATRSTRTSSMPTRARKDPGRARATRRARMGHLIAQARVAQPGAHVRWRELQRPRTHPSFRVVAGGVADWERA